MRERYPPIEPHDHGWLDVGDSNRVYWEASGDPEGKPALVVHGGPGAGSGPGFRRSFDPQRYRIIQFDQRGCGLSSPHASDPGADMSVNTTHHLIADMERLRTHLGVERWLLFGGSWGSTLILAYAERHPERVSEIVLLGVTMSRRSEIDWLYRGVGRFFPEEWALFRDGVPEAERDDLPAAYARLMESPYPDVRNKAAADWLSWEDAVISLEPKGQPQAYKFAPARRSARVRADLCALLLARRLARGRGAAAQRGQAGRHSRRAAARSTRHGVAARDGVGVGAGMADAELVVIDDSGHTGSPAYRDEILRATERFAVVR